MDIPSFSELYRLAPIAVLIVSIIAIGFFAGFKSREDHIKNLLDFLKYFKDK